MQPFEFILILVSIISGLGIAALLGGVARILRGELTPYWVHHLWVLSVLLLLIEHMWSLFYLEARTQWTLVDLADLLIPPMLLFLISSLLFPATNEERDLSRFYYAKRRPVFGLLATLFLYYSLSRPPLSAEDFFQLPAIAVFIALFFMGQRRVHSILSLLHLMGNVAFMFLFSFTLGASDT